MAALNSKPLKVFLNSVDEYAENKENLNPAEHIPSQRVCEYISFADISFTNNQNMPPMPGALQQTILLNLDVVTEKLMKKKLEHLAGGAVEHAQVHFEGHSLLKIFTNAIQLLLNSTRMYISI